MPMVSALTHMRLARCQRHSLQHNERIAGFSLVELLIAMTLGLILMSGMIAVFAGNKRSSDLNAAMANMQESARFMLERMAADARMSGFQGCMDLESGEPVVVADGWPRTNAAVATSPLTILRSSVTTGSVVGATSWSPAPQMGFDTDDVDALPGTHALTLQFGGPEVSTLTGQMIKAGKPDRSADITVNLLADGSDLPINSGDFAILSNCDSADIFRVTSVDTSSATHTVFKHNTTLNSTPQLQRAYGDAKSINQTLMMRFNSNIYYVADTDTVSDDGDPISALYLQTLPYNDADNPPIELVQGVENLRVAFGIRNADGSLQYAVPGGTGYDPTRVESVRIGLLMASRDRIAQKDDTNTYVLAGQPIAARSDTNTGADTHPADRRFRLAFNTTVKIRNRRTR